MNLRNPGELTGSRKSHSISWRTPQSWNISSVEFERIPRQKMNSPRDRALHHDMGRTSSSLIVRFASVAIHVPLCGGFYDLGIYDLA